MDVRLCGALVLGIATALGGRATAAEQGITPLAANDCQTLAQTIGQAVGIALTAKVGAPEFPSGLRGNACVMSGHVTGLKAEFDDVRKKLNASLSGWTPVSDYDADGPASTMTGFAKASQRVVYRLETEPPRGTCENVPLAACKVPHQQWNWNLKLVGFSQ
jgi:hypothetical protein